MKKHFSDNLERPFDQNIKFEPSKRVRTSEANLPNTNFVNLNDIEISLNRALPTQGQSGSTLLIHCRYTMLNTLPDLECSLQIIL